MPPPPARIYRVNLLYCSKRRCSQIETHSNQYISILYLISIYTIYNISIYIKYIKQYSYIYISISSILYPISDFHLNIYTLYTYRVSLQFRVYRLFQNIVVHSIIFFFLFLANFIKYRVSCFVYPFIFDKSLNPEIVNLFLSLPNY